MSETDRPESLDVPVRNELSEPLMLSYARPLDPPARRISGVSNPAALIVRYLVGCSLMTWGFMLAVQLHDPYARRQSSNVDFSSLMNSSLVALASAGVATILFAFAVTRRVFPESLPPRKRPVWLGFLAGVAHPLILIVIGEASLHFGSEPNFFGILLVPLLYFAIPPVAGILISRQPAPAKPVSDRSQ